MSHVCLRVPCIVRCTTNATGSCQAVGLCTPNNFILLSPDQIYKLMMNTLYVTPISMVEARIYMTPPFLVVKHGIYQWLTELKFPYANPMTDSLRLKLM